MCFAAQHSGAEDGTATAARSKDPRVKLGRALESVIAGWGENEDAWKLVNMTVINPVTTVDDRIRCWSPLIFIRLFVAVVTIVVVVCTSVFWRMGPALSEVSCSLVSFANGQLAGDCDGGVAGSTCTYVSCDDGFSFVPALESFSSNVTNIIPADVRDASPVAPCRNCWGSGLHCETNNGSCSQPTRNSNSGLLGCRHTEVNSGSDRELLCVGVATPMCDSCTTASWDSGWHACEISGTPWGTAPTTSFVPTAVAAA